VFSVPSPLRITELHYNPLGGGDAIEFIELQNTSATASLDLTGFKLVREAISGDGVEYEFSLGDANLTLAPGEYRVVARDRAAFVAAYPYAPAQRIADREFTGNLANEGEQLELVDDVGGLIQRFTYDDAWLPATDGGGYSLVVRDPLADVTEWSTAAAWRASLQIGGSPGERDLMAGDVNLDNRVDLTDLAVLQAHLGTPTAALRSDGDLDGDGAVTATDAALLARNLGRGANPAAPSASEVIARTEPRRLYATRRPTMRPAAVDAALPGTQFSHRKLPHEASARLGRAIVAEFPRKN
jgi:hypothetical protein